MYRFAAIGSSLTPAVLVAALALSAQSPTWAQTDETCVAYVEADAAYRDAHTAALNNAREVGREAYTSAMLPYQRKHKDAYRTAFKAASEAAKKTGRRCGGPFPDTEAGEAALRSACEAYEAARRTVLEAYEIDDVAAEKRAKRAEAEAIEDFKEVAIRDARVQRDRAYHAAYGGPTSKVASVMRKLINTDRERCRDRLER